MTSEEVTNEPCDEVISELTTEPWVMFGGHIYKSLEWNEMVETFVVGQLMMASNFSLFDNMKFGEGQIISIQCIPMIIRQPKYNFKLKNFRLVI